MNQKILASNGIQKMITKDGRLRQRIVTRGGGYTKSQRASVASSLPALPNTVVGHMLPLSATSQALVALAPTVVMLEPPAFLATARLALVGAFARHQALLALAHGAGRSWRLSLVDRWQSCRPEVLAFVNICTSARRASRT